MNNKLKLIIAAITSALVVTLGLFYLMSWLISGGKTMKPSDANEQFIDFVRIKRDNPVETKKRKLPKKPEVKERELPKEEFKVADDSAPDRPDMKFDTPKMDIDLATGDGGMGVAGGGGGVSGDSDETPLIRIEPQFPPDAAIKGIQKGWVRLIFDLDTQGGVTNIRVVGASPRGVFEESAVKAVREWKYRPKVVDGKAVERRDLKTQLNFKLEK